MHDSHYYDSHYYLIVMNFFWLLKGIGSLAVLPIGVYGRFTTFPLITGHGGRVTDFDFSPFNHELLATGSDDGVIKLWQIPNDLNNNVRLSESALNLGPFVRGHSYA